MAIIIRRDRRNPLQGDIVITRKATADYWIKLRERAKKRYPQVRCALDKKDHVFMTAGHWIFYFFTNPQEAERIFWN